MKLGVLEEASMAESLKEKETEKQKEKPKEPAVVERVTEIVEVHKTPAWLGGLAICAILLSFVTLAWVYLLQSHIAADETALSQSGISNSELKEQLNDTNMRLKAQGQALGQKVGMTQKQLEEKSDTIVTQAKNALAATSKLANHQDKTDENIEAVRNDVSSVRSDVTAVKSDVATTQNEQNAIKKSVSKVAADTTELSTKVATNTKDIDTVKHKNDRTFYEFAVEKGAPPINLGTIKLSAKMVDVKNSKFTLVIGSDDKRIEKVNQSLNQSITFYSGKNPELFEVVVTGISKKMIAGYLSVPKDAPKPMLP
jgi:hypothetical protein